MIEPKLLHLESWAGRRIGLLGGSFNPPHLGHVKLSLYALRYLRLDAIWWIVSFRHPDKPAADFLPFEERIAQARKLAVHPKIVVCALEQQVGTGCTIELLKVVCQRFKRSQLIWLMGSDNLSCLASWQHWPKLFAQLPVAVLRRWSASAAVTGGAVQTNLIQPVQGHKVLWCKAARSFERYRLCDQRAYLVTRLRPPVWIVCRNRYYDYASSVIRDRQGADGLNSPAGIHSLVKAILADGQAENVASIDLKGRTSIADFMVIASARSVRHSKALAEQLYQQLKDHKVPHLHTEGFGISDWLVIDAGDVIVHLFHDDRRQLYALEKLWGDSRADETATICVPDGSTSNESLRASWLRPHAFEPR